MLGDRNTSSEKLEQTSSQQSFQIRPHLAEKFRPQAAKEVIAQILSENLKGKVYSNEECDQLTKNIALEIREKIRALEFNRYKLIVQVVLGEQRGAGVTMGARCLWDSDADSYASAEYETASMFCVASVFAVFVY